MSNLQERIMNLPSPAYIEDAETEMRISYKTGHKDALDAAAELALQADACMLVQERDALRLMVTWAYGKLHSRTFTSMDDALELDRLKLWCEHGVLA